MNWFMGGVFNDDHSGSVFDLKTGERLRLSDLDLGMDGETLLANLKTIIWDYVRDFAFPEAYDTIQGYTLDGLSFYLYGAGEVVICIPEYELAPGMANSLLIPTGIYVAAP